MKEIIIRRINVVSLMKPLFLFAGSIGGIVGLLMTIFLFPTRTTSVQDTQGYVFNTSAPIAGALGTMGTMIFLIVANCLGIALVIVSGVALYNLLCKLTGGIKVEIEELND